jgi:hypothetical protein
VIIMRKFILSAVTVGALALGGAAQAQDILGGIGDAIGQIFGIGPTYSTGIPGVVAQGAYPPGTVYTDPYGRRVLVEPSGRQVLLDPNGAYPLPQNAGLMGRTVTDPYGRRYTLGQYGSSVDPVGRRIYLGPDGRPAYVEQNGQLYSYASVFGNIAYGGEVSDRDGDGIANSMDRYPDDPRYH